MLASTLHTFSPSEINTYIKQLLEFDESLNDCWVEGEITNCRFYQKGQQYYFNLNDGQSQINCVIYATFLDLLTFEPTDGIKVRARGKIKTFHKRGTYSLQIAFMEQKGKGSLAEQFEALKKQLFSEGLFDVKFKKSLPKYPKCIGLITAKKSAAEQDVLTVITKAASFVNVIPRHATMQGPTSSQSVIDALKFLSSQPVDVVIITRGGGSVEDLASFNDEALIRFVFEYPHPVISAIGHDVDVTLLDFVADLRAQTPTAAAQNVVSFWAQAFLDLSQYFKRLSYLLNQKISDAKSELIYKLDSLQSAFRYRLNTLKNEMAHLQKRLEIANPLHKLNQGFSITRHENKVVKSVRSVEFGDTIITQFVDGTVTAKIESIDEPK